MSELPYLTADIAGLPGNLKQTDADFYVEELPLYELEGDGDHVYCCVEKRGLTTNTLVRELAARLNVDRKAIGFAGLKDANAITRQCLSIEHVTPEAIEALEIYGVRVLWTKRHRNKLKRGHLVGNRFRIVLRECDTSRIEEVRAVLERLTTIGMPNYFGPQRFGLRGDSAEVGGALLVGDHQRVVNLIAGSPNQHDFGDVLRARELFDGGQFEAASKLWPRGFELSAKLCFEMHKYRGRASRATHSLTKSEKGFFVSAWQSELFNQVLAARMPNIAEVELGEFAWNHGGRRAFQIRELGPELERARRFEVSAAGPLFGPASTLSNGTIGELEQQVLDSAQIRLELLDKRRFAGAMGGRRPLRVQPTEVSASALDAASLELHFCLPEGAYATSLVREIRKGSPKRP